MAEKDKEAKQTEAAGNAPAVATQNRQVRIAIDDRGVTTESCDYWLMNSTPEEIILRLGSTKANPQGPVKITHRIALNYYSAKRLLTALYQTVQNYEKALGTLDVEPAAEVKGQAVP